MINDIEFYLYVFLIFVWLIYILNSLYQNYKMKRFLPKRVEEIFTIPFYIFSLLTFFSLTKRLTNIILINNTENIIIFRSFWSIGLIFIGIFFCFFSIFLYIYVNFFEKSFPSCITTKNNKPLQGIYNYIRHPSYYIFFFITFGTALCLLNFLLFIVACINHMCLYFYYMIEENQIRKTNSYYNEYLKKTKRFLPNLSKLSPS